MRIQIPKKLRAEDFKSDQQDLIQKIAYVYNSFCDEVYSVLNKNIDYENLNRQIIDIIVKIGDTGEVLSTPQIKTSVRGKIRGLLVLNALNQVNSRIYPTSAPFVSWTINGDILTILNITGLQNNSEYKLTLELVV